MVGERRRREKEEEDTDYHHHPSIYRSVPGMGAYL